MKRHNKRTHGAGMVSLLLCACVLVGSACSAGADAVSEATTAPVTAARGEGPETLPSELIASCSVDGLVDAILLHDGVFYLGGEFTSVASADGDDVARKGLAACDAASGEVLDWYPTGGANERIRTIAVDDDWLYVGGDFTTIGGTERTHLARVSLGNAAVDEGWAPDPNRPVRMVQVAEDGRVYVGGVFGRIAKARQPALARLFLDGSLDTSFLPEFTFDGEYRAGVFAMTTSPVTGDLFVAGKFSAVNRRARSSAASIDAASGRVTRGFSPELKDTNPDDPVVQVHQILWGAEGVYICGDFWKIEGEGIKTAQRNVGRFDPETGTADPSWKPVTDGGVQDCALSTSTDSLIMGGHYDQVNGEENKKLTAVSLSDGSVRPFLTANSVSGVWAVTELSDATIAVGGAFTTVGEEAQQGFAVLGYVARPAGEGSTRPAGDNASTPSPQS